MSDPFFDFDAKCCEPGCEWEGYLDELYRDRDGVTHCPVCHSVAIKEGRADKGAKDSPLDECDCGDFRQDHVDGTGRCLYPTHHIPDPELNVCRKFRLAGRAGWRERYRNCQGAL